MYGFLVLALLVPLVLVALEALVYERLWGVGLPRALLATLLSDAAGLAATVLLLRAMPDVEAPQQWMLAFLFPALAKALVALALLSWRARNLAGLVVAVLVASIAVSATLGYGVVVAMALSAP